MTRRMSVEQDKRKRRELREQRFKTKTRKETAMRPVQKGNKRWLVFIVPNILL